MISPIIRLLTVMGAASMPSYTFWNSRRMKVPKEIERLHYNARQQENLTDQADAELKLPTIQVNSFELAIEMLPDGS